MAYNNGFPLTYPQYYPQYPQAQTPQNTQITQPQINGPQMPTAPQSNSIIWVQGEAGAKSYLVAPNTTVQLWDSEEQVIYLKSADASGMPSMKILDYKIREANPAPVPAITAQPTADYVTRDELSAFEEKIKEQLRKLSEKPKKEVKGNE